MKTFILCGGMGTRLDDEGKLKPKPLVCIGQEPILLHILKIYSHYNFNEFVLCLGNKGKMIINYFIKKYKKKIILQKKIKGMYYIEIKKNKFIWKIYFINTKNNFGTAGRIKYAYNKLNLSEDIMMTYGDGVSDVNIKKLYNFHYDQNTLATVTSVNAPYRYGTLEIKKNLLKKFNNTKSSNTKINGGFFIIDQRAIKFINNYLEYWEEKPMQKIIKIKKFSSFFHNGFWHSLDTLKDKQILNKMWFNKKAPWKLW